MIRDQGGATLTLTIGAFLFALAVGLPLGGWRAATATPGPTPASASSASSPTPLRSSGSASCSSCSVVELFPGWPTSGIATPITIFTVQPQTHILLVDSILAGDSTATTDVLKHHVLPCFTLGTAAVRRDHPSGPDQRDPGDEGRLRRGGPGPRDLRAQRRAPARLPQRAGPGDHGDRPPGRADARGRGAHRTDLQLARASATSWSSTSTPATTSPCRAWSRSSLSWWWCAAWRWTSSTPSSTRGCGTDDEGFIKQIWNTKGLARWILLIGW